MVRTAEGPRPPWPLLIIMGLILSTPLPPGAEAAPVPCGEACGALTHLSHMLALHHPTASLLELSEGSGTPYRDEDRIRIVSQLGEGTYARVYSVMVEVKGGNEFLAMKVPKLNAKEMTGDLSYRDQDTMASFGDEFAAMVELQSMSERDGIPQGFKRAIKKNIVNYYGYAFVSDLPGVTGAHDLEVPVRAMSEADMKPYEFEGLDSLQIFNKFQKVAREKGKFVVALLEDCSMGNLEDFVNNRRMEMISPLNDLQDAFYRVAHNLLQAVEIITKYQPAQVPILGGVDGGGAAVDGVAAMMHQDIKPSNILICEAGNEEYVPKLADFGLAKRMLVPKVFTSFEGFKGFTRSQLSVQPGTTIYNPPEVLLFRQIHAAGRGGMTAEHKNQMKAFGFTWNGYRDVGHLKLKLKFSAPDNERIPFALVPIDLKALYARDMWSAGVTLFEMFDAAESSRLSSVLGWSAGTSHGKSFEAYVLEGCLQYQNDPTPHYFDSPFSAKEGSVWDYFDRVYGPSSAVTKMLQGMLMCNPAHRITPRAALRLLRKSSLRQVVRRRCFFACVEGIMSTASGQDREHMQSYFNKKVSLADLPHHLIDMATVIQGVCLNGVMLYSKKYSTVWEGEWGQFPLSCSELNFTPPAGVSRAASPTPGSRSPVHFDDIMRNKKISAGSPTDSYSYDVDASPDGHGHDDNDDTFFDSVDTEPEPIDQISDISHATFLESLLGPRYLGHFYSSDTDESGSDLRASRSESEDDVSQDGRGRGRRTSPGRRPVLNSRLNMSLEPESPGTDSEVRMFLGRGFTVPYSQSEPPSDRDELEPEPASLHKIGIYVNSAVNTAVQRPQPVHRSDSVPGQV